MTTPMVKVLLPIIRRVMPTIIANDLIGVSPMSGPAGNIFTLQERYRNGWAGRLKLNKDHYRYFLRIYNRRIHHHPEYITSLGYPHVRVSRRDSLNIVALDWCLDNLKPGTWIYNNSDFWFADQNDYVLFRMSCL